MNKKLTISFLYTVSQYIGHQFHEKIVANGFTSFVNISIGKKFLMCDLTLDRNDVLASLKIRVSFS